MEAAAEQGPRGGTAAQPLHADTCCASLAGQPGGSDKSSVGMLQPGWWQEESCWGVRGTSAEGGEEAAARCSRCCGGAGLLQALSG